MTLVLILAYVALQIALAVWVGRGARSDTDYLVAGRSLSAGAVGMSIFATWFAAESLIATSSEVAAQGLAGARAEPLAYAAGLVAVALFFAHRLRSGGFITLADFLRDRFGGATEGLAAAVIALSATTWSAAQLFAFAAIIDTASGIGFVPALLGATLLVMTYTLFGGLAGDVITDILQGIVILVAIAILFALMTVAAGGPAAMWAALPPAALSPAAPPGESWADTAELWLIPIIGTMVSQEAISRTLAARTPEAARTGALLGAGVYLAAGLVPVAFGLFAPQLSLPLGEGEAFLPSLAKALFPGWLLIVFTGALVSAILSSVDSALLAASAVITESGYRRLNPAASDRQLLRAARTATVAAAALAAGLALTGETLRELVLDAGAIGAVLAVPIIAGLAGSRARHAALAAVVVQMAALVLLDWVLGLPGAFLWMLASGTLTFAALALWERRRAPPGAAVGDT
ncbi:sodium:solute symporter family transporter [Erythrobacter oryzae]|uniref:sodium:solute symporter family transporter n=1 Tax=Erythrobacter oryzae TaxID=3019556 RepID=UPI00300FEB71